MTQSPKKQKPTSPNSKKVKEKDGSYKTKSKVYYDKRHGGVIDRCMLARDNRLED